MYRHADAAGECTGISFVDAMALKVCHNLRIPQHKVFRGCAERSKSSMGWFYGFKLHLCINDCGECGRRIFASKWSLG
jgi:hypothetical protein